MKDNLSPWEEWFIGKEKELRARLQARAAEVNTCNWLSVKSNRREQGQEFIFLSCENPSSFVHCFLVFWASVMFVFDNADVIHATCVLFC